jgi:hypothetical protein
MCKVKQLELENKKIVEQSKDQNELKNINKYACIKPKSKDVIVGVTES